MKTFGSHKQKMGLFGVALMVAAGMLKYKPAVEPLLSVYGLGPEKKGTLKKVGDKVKGRLTYLPPRDEAALWALSLMGDEKAEQKP